MMFAGVEGLSESIVCSSGPPTPTTATYINSSLCSPRTQPDGQIQQTATYSRLAEDQEMRAVERLFEREHQEQQTKKQMHAASRAYFRRHFSMTPRGNANRSPKINTIAASATA